MNLRFGSKVNYISRYVTHVRLSLQSPTESKSKIIVSSSLNGASYHD